MGWDVEDGMGECETWSHVYVVWRSLWQQDVVVGIGPRLNLHDEQTLISCVLL